MSEFGQNMETPVIGEAADKSVMRNVLAERNQALDQEVKLALSKKVHEVTSVDLPRPSDYASINIEEEISETISKAVGVQNVVLGPPTKRNDQTRNVDLAINTVSIARSSGADVKEVAQSLAEDISECEDISTAETVGPFVNIELNYESFAPKVFSEVKRFGDHFGHTREGIPSVVLVDYSSPNVAKDMTVGHLRSTVIGHSLVKIQEAIGNIPFGVNHLGDWGSQFGDYFYQYRKEITKDPEGITERLERDPTGTLMGLYRSFNLQKANDPDAIEESRRLFLELERLDPELLELWGKFRDWSILAFEPNYSRLGVEFDATQGESFYEDRMDAAVQDALDKGVLAKNGEGSVVFPSQEVTDPTTGKVNTQIMLDKEGGGRDEVILKPSGGTTYITRDLAAIRYRAEELKVDKILYVIGKEQKGHCLELFAMSDKSGYMPLGSAEHISFGHFNVNGRKMASRSGQVALLKDVLDDAEAAARNFMKERKAARGDDTNLTDSEIETARMIGVGSIIFNDLRQNREKDIEFDPDNVSSAEAGSSAYIQYTNARLSRILEKNEAEPAEDLGVPDNITATEKRIISEASRFPIIIKEAARSNTPHKIATYLTELCQLVSVFYGESPVTNAESDIEKNFRLNIVRTAKQVIKNASGLLHLELPEEM